MRIPVSVTDQGFYFVPTLAGATIAGATDDWTVEYSKNGATAFTTMTTPTITEIEEGGYFLTCDEGMTLTAGNHSEAMLFLIKHDLSEFDPTWKEIEIYRPDVTPGNQLGVESDGDATKVNTLNGHTAQTGDNFTRLGVAGAGLTDITINAASVDAIWDEIIVGSHNTNNSAGKTLRLLKEAGGYSGGKIYINPNGTAGTTDYENGTDSNPVTTLADALTLSTSLNINTFEATRDATLAPAADFNNRTVFGNGYTFTLGGHDYAGTHIYHASPLTGIATSSGNTDHFDMLECIIGDITVDDAHLTRCILTGTITLSGVGTGTPGELKMINCWSGIPGSSTPILDFGTGSENHNVTIGAYENGLEIRNFNVTTTGGTDLLSISGTGQLVIAASCDGGTIHLRGQWKVTDNSGGAVTITQDDVATSIIAIEADTNELQTDDVPTLIAALNDAPAVSAAAIVNEWETQSQADPTGFHVNVKEINGAGVIGDGNATPWDGA